MAGHVTGGIDGDEKTGHGDDQTEQQAQPVQTKRQVQIQAGHPDPLRRENHLRSTTRGQARHNSRNSPKGSRQEYRPSLAAVRVHLRFQAGFSNMPTGTETKVSPLNEWSPGPYHPAGFV